ncbi:hypothetical protein PG993_014420 [Apiospora rasikravindrae]|uniref:Uncharacterized protein n=1 Tax=Apiospora rasikravindrae TaxID=990691 RepID=A0ABR1RMM3_9PEZI
MAIISRNAILNVETVLMLQRSSRTIRVVIGKPDRGGNAGVFADFQCASQTIYIMWRLYTHIDGIKTSKSWGWRAKGASRGLWACCGTDANGQPDCTQQTNDTFNLASPRDLKPYFAIPASGFQYTSSALSSTSSIASSSVATTATTTTSTPAASSSSQPDAGGSSSGSGLSSGAAAGIGVGAGLAVVSVASLMFWYLARKRRRARQEIPPQSYQFNSQAPVHHTSGAQQEGSMKPELDSQGLPRELPT